MEYHYKTEEVCPKEIVFELNDGMLSHVQFLYGGCPGNLQALPRLVENMSVEEVTQKLEGIKCGRKNTSCADQLVKAIKKAYEEEKKVVS